MFHYVSCGLPNIWLKNGFIEIETEYGPAVSIENVQGLHQVIAMSIIDSTSRMTGAEFRFLRKELDLSQKRLAELMGVEDQTVANWEKRAPVGPAALVMRMVAKAHYADCGFRDFIEKQAELDRKEHEELYFEELESGWQPALAA